jgi:hypothetical protein
LKGESQPADKGPEAFKTWPWSKHGLPASAIVRYENLFEQSRQDQDQALMQINGLNS